MINTFKYLESEAWMPWIYMILCTAGGWSTEGDYHDEVLLYNSEEDEWSTVGHLSTARSSHAISLVPGNTVDLCLR